MLKLITCGGPGTVLRAEGVWGEGGRVEPTKPTRASSHGRGAAAAVDSGAAVSRQEER